jgi:parvulin-like peptidyl-prolyl isomerase
MKLLRISLATLGLAAVFALSACGGSDGGSVPDDAVAVVGGTEIARSELQELVDQAKKTYEAQDQQFPTAGTPEYKNVQAQYVKFLVQREQFAQEAEELGIEVTDKDVDAEVEKFIDSRFEGKRAAYLKALKAQGFTEEALRETLRASVLAQKLFDEITKDVDVPEADIAAYYQANQASYGSPESRVVRHVLVAEKNGEEVDYAKSKTEADRLYAELKGGADFAALAKAESDDPSAQQNSGKLTITRGQTVPEFDKAAFELKVGAISEPVKTSYGYHVIEALSTVKKATTTPLSKVRTSIKATLLQEKKTSVMTEWVEELEKSYEGKVSYAADVEPPELPETTETETETEPGTD